MLFAAAAQAKIGMSLATVYNTLNQFAELGLLRRIGVDGTKTYFDTNVSEHGHFYFEHSHELVDIADPLAVVAPMGNCGEPFCPAGHSCDRIVLGAYGNRVPASA